MHALRLALGAVTIAVLAAAVAFSVAERPEQLVIDLMYSLTGFCIGFLYATYLYEGSHGGPRRGQR